MKKWAIRIFSAVAILVFIALALVFFNLNSIVKKGVETVGPQLTKVDVRLDSATLSPMNGNGELNKLFVGNPEGYKTPSAIEIGNVKIAVKLGSILSDTIVVESVNVQAPVVTFEGGLAGNNLSQILKNLEGSPDDVQPIPDGKPTSESSKKFFVKDVVVNGGEINVHITGLGETSFTVALPPIHLTDIGSENNGVTAAQLFKEILKPVIASAYKAAIESISKSGVDLKNLDSDDAKKALEGVKGLFKK